MTDKEKIKTFAQKRLNENMYTFAQKRLNENMYKAQTIGCLHTIAANEDKELISFIDSLHEEPASEDLEKEYHNFLKREWFDKPGKTISEMMRLTAEYFANWQKEQMMKEACEWLKENIWKRLYVCDGEAGFPTAEFLKDFRKAMED